MWLLDQPAPLVGLRLGTDRPSGLAYDAGVAFLVGPVSSNPGPLLGNTVSSFVRASLALRYAGPLTETLHYDLGSSVTAGLGDAEYCGGADVCTGGGAYAGAGPAVGIVYAVGKRVGIRLSARYEFSLFAVTAEPDGLSLKAGVRFWP